MNDYNLIEECLNTIDITNDFVLFDKLIPKVNIKSIQHVIVANLSTIHTRYLTEEVGRILSKLCYIHRYSNIKEAKFEKAYNSLAAIVSHLADKYIMIAKQKQVRYILYKHKTDTVKYEVTKAIVDGSCIMMKIEFKENGGLQLKLFHYQYDKPSERGEITVTGVEEIKKLYGEVNALTETVLNKLEEIVNTIRSNQSESYKQCVIEFEQLFEKQRGLS